MDQEYSSLHQKHLHRWNEVASLISLSSAQLCCQKQEALVEMPKLKFHQGSRHLLPPNRLLTHCVFEFCDEIHRTEESVEKELLTPKNALFLLSPRQQSRFSDEICLKQGKTEIEGRTGGCEKGKLRNRTKAKGKAKRPFEEEEEDEPVSKDSLVSIFSSLSLQKFCQSCE